MSGVHGKSASGRGRLGADLESLPGKGEALSEPILRTGERGPARGKVRSRRHKVTPHVAGLELVSVWRTGKCLHIYRHIGAGSGLTFRPVEKFEPSITPSTTHQSSNRSPPRMAGCAPL